MRNISKLPKTLVLLLLMLCVFGVLVTAQTQVKLLWQKCLGGSSDDFARCVQQTKDGGYIVVGFTYSAQGDVSANHGESDIWILKLDADGDIQWQRSLGGSSYDEAYSVQQTVDESYIIAGYAFSNDGDVSGKHGSWDGWIVKLDKDGNIQWQRCFGGSSDDRAYSVQQTNDGGYIFVGEASSNDGDVSGNHGANDGWVVKINANGAIQWQKCVGGSDFEAISHVQQTADGGYALAGYTTSRDGDVKGNHGRKDAWIVRLDQSGKIEWQKCLGGSDWDEAYNIRQTKDGGYVVAGYTQSKNGDVTKNQGDYDYWVVKLDKTGKIEWQRSLGGSARDAAMGIQQTTDGGCLVAGYTQSNNGDVSGNHGQADIWLVKLSENGNIEWQKCFGGSYEDKAYSVQQIAGGYILVGQTKSNDGDVKANHGSSDFWVLKLGYE